MQYKTTAERNNAETLGQLLNCVNSHYWQNLWAYTFTMLSIGILNTFSFVLLSLLVREGWGFSASSRKAYGSEEIVGLGKKGGVCNALFSALKLPTSDLFYFSYSSPLHPQYWLLRLPYLYSVWILSYQFLSLLQPLSFFISKEKMASIVMCFARQKKAQFSFLFLRFTEPCFDPPICRIILTISMNKNGAFLGNIYGLWYLFCYSIICSR